MGLEIATIALIAGATATVGGQIMQYRASQDSKDLQRQRQSEEKASNAAAAARERRQQIREERVRRARILQSSENTGTAGSSGEFGAVGALSTNLNSNIGTNLGALAASDRMSSLNQGIADAQSDMNTGQLVGQFGSTLFGIGGKLGGSSDGGNSIFQSNPTGSQSLSWPTGPGE